VADDIVPRLRIIHCAGDNLTPCGTCLPCQAADEIERLREQSDGWQATAAGLSEDIGNAEDEIERLQHQMERLSVALDDISHLTTDHQVLHRIKEARRG